MGFDVQMKKLIIACLIVLVLSNICFALRIGKPQRITDYNQNGLVILNEALEKLWDLTNGRYNANVVTSVPTDSTTEGEFRFSYSGTQKKLYAYINGAWTYVPIDGDVYDDIRVSGLSTLVNATAPNLIAFAPATTNLIVYGFDGAATTEQCYFAIQLPHTYKEGSDIHPHVHWTPTDANAGTVIWSLEYTWANNGGTFSAPTTINSPAIAAGGIAWVSKYSYFADISGTGKEVSSMLICRLFRNPANDTYEHDVALLEVDFHFVKDSLGSVNELSK